MIDADGKIIITTEVDNRKFDKQIDELTQQANDIEAKLKDPVKYQLDTTKAEAQLERLQNKIDNLDKKSLQGSLNKISNLKFSPSGMSGLSGGYELKDGVAGVVRLNKILPETSDLLEDINEKQQDVGEQSARTAQMTDFNFKKIGSTLKKVGLSLFGIRSAYAVVSRASSAYLSQDIELAKKLRSVWVGLGSFLAPVLEMISNSLLKALGYLNVFIKALTGIDFLARANAKALQAQAAAQKELNNQTYDFDVIRTQQDNSSSGGGGGVGGGMFDIPELDEKIVKKLQEMAKWLKENWHWIKEVGKILLITFGAVKVAQVLSGIAGLLGGAGSGLLGLNSVLSTLAAIGIVAIGVSLIYTALTGQDLITDLKNIKIGIDELKKSTEQNTEAEAHFTDQLVELNEQILKNIETNQFDDEQRQNTINRIKNETTAIEEQIKAIETTGWKTQEHIKQEQELEKQLESNIEVYEKLYNQNLLNDEETLDYMDALADLIVVKQRLGENTDGLKRKYEELRVQTGKDKDANYELKDSAQAIEDKYKELTGTRWKVNLNADTNQAESGVTKFVRWLNDLVKKPFTFWMDVQETSHGGSSGGGHSGGGRAYALGGIVTQPTRALIGEAGYPEAVVPMTADYLSTLANEIARAGGSRGSSQPVYVYLDGHLIQRQVSTKQQQYDFIMNN